MTANEQERIEVQVDAIDEATLDNGVVVLRVNTNDPDRVEELRKLSGLLAAQLGERMERPPLVLVVDESTDLEALDEAAAAALLEALSGRVPAALPRPVVLKVEEW